MNLFQNIAAVLHSRGWLKDRTECPVKVRDAVKAFQRWLGLEDDGDLDPDTLQHLSAPRFCALPDVLPLGTSLCKWPDGAISYFVRDPLPGHTLDETWNVIQWGMAQWAAVAGVSPIRANTAAGARILVTVASLDGPAGVLADSQLPCGAIVQSLQRYDRSEAAWWKQPVAAGVTNAHLVAMHELGHGAIGLEHAPGTGSVMSPVFDSRILKPQTWDINQAVLRYGLPTTPPPLPPVVPEAGQIVIDIGAKTVKAPAGYRLLQS